MKKKRVVRKSGDKIVRMKKNRRGAAKAGLIFLLVIVAALVLMLTPWFNITSIEVTGNEYVEEESIIAAAGINPGENIFRINVKRSKDAVREIPYIDDVKIYRLLPAKVTIDVTERAETAYISCGDGYMLIDEDGRALEFTNITWGIPEITGIEAEALKEGEFIAPSDGSIVTVLKEAMSKLKEYELSDRVTAIDISEPDNIKFTFDKNKEIITGGNFRIDYKLMMLKAVIEEIAPSEAGRIDLSVEGKALFSPSEE